MNSDKIKATADEIKKAISENDFTKIEKLLYNGDYKNTIPLIEKVYSII